MASSKKQLAKHDYISKLEMVDMNPIDKFIFEFEPSNSSGRIVESDFRNALLEALNYEDEETKTERNTVVVNSFMEHCKENGIEISDSIFESYFQA